MANLQAASSYQPSRPQAFKTPSMKKPDCIDGTQLFKVRSFLQSFKLIFPDNKANFSKYRKRFLYATSFLIGRDEKYFELYLSNLTNKDSEYLLNNWALLESQVITFLWIQMKLEKLKKSSMA
ncbi:hypothetical protein O181_090335 [Austropuccinia psidii MF-1]|uniref:Uncharacterized protein n=1 Tax=Austropuccinia psidii MF-1 TaxID=1389203 RepID=A0A9Q3IUV8_9BASI|nr:hypothetical protein [Austropuccinia psidii MF-1]